MLLLAAAARTCEALAVAEVQAGEGVQVGHRVAQGVRQLGAAPQGQVVEALQVPQHLQALHRHPHAVPQHQAPQPRQRRQLQQPCAQQKLLG